MLIKNISLVIVDVNSNIIFSSIISDKNSNEMFFIGNCWWKLWWNRKNKKIYWQFDMSIMLIKLGMEISSINLNELKPNGFLFHLFLLLHCLSK